LVFGKKEGDQKIRARRQPREVKEMGRVHARGREYNQSGWGMRQERQGHERCREVNFSVRKEERERIMVWV
jgi:predicted NAD-dependent protein-ADP-ribosyltransferase YbiA (DUF1768 family)